MIIRAIICVAYMAFYDRFKKELSKELITVAWHPKDGGISVCQKIRKKKWNHF